MLCVEHHVVGYVSEWQPYEDSIHVIFEHYELYIKVSDIEPEELKFYEINAYIYYLYGYDSNHNYHSKYVFSKDIWTKDYLVECKKRAKQLYDGISKLVV